MEEKQQSEQASLDLGLCFACEQERVVLTGAAAYPQGIAILMQNGDLSVSETTTGKHFNLAAGEDRLSVVEFRQSIDDEKMLSTLMTLRKFCNGVADLVEACGFAFPHVIGGDPRGSYDEDEWEDMNDAATNEYVELLSGSPPNAVECWSSSDELLADENSPSDEESFEISFTLEELNELGIC